MKVIITEVCEKFCFSLHREKFLYFPAISRDKLFPRSLRAAGWKAGGQLKGLEDQSRRRGGYHQRRGCAPRGHAQREGIVSYLLPNSHTA